MAKKKEKECVVWKEGRDAETGKFLPVDEARRRKKTAVVESIKRKK